MSFFLVCCAVVLFWFDYWHESCVFDSGSSARATQPFPSVTQRRGASASLVCYLCRLEVALASPDAAPS